MSGLLSCFKDDDWAPMPELSNFTFISRVSAQTHTLTLSIRIKTIHVFVVECMKYLETRERLKCQVYTFSETNPLS